MRLTIDIDRDPEHPGTWVARCLELDVTSAASEPDRALVAVASAVRIATDLMTSQSGNSPLLEMTRRMKEVADRQPPRGAGTTTIPNVWFRCAITELVDKIESLHGTTMLETPDVELTHDVCLAIGSYVPRYIRGFSVVTRGVFQSQPDGTVKVVAGDP